MIALIVLIQPVLRQECWQGQAFLELDFVFRHDVTLAWAESQCRQFSLRVVAEVRWWSGKRISLFTGFLGCAEAG